MSTSRDPRESLDLEPLATSGNQSALTSVQGLSGIGPSLLSMNGDAVRHRLGLLVVGLAIASVGIAACSSTTSESSGAAQDDATASASASPGPTVAPEPSCADGGACEIGDIGPGNGIVFYVAPYTFQSAAPCGSSCTYLEAQMTDSAGGSLFPYCTGPGQTSVIPNSTNSAIGGGFQNTLSITASNECSAGAGFAASAPSGGFNDWYLPSVSELSALVQSQNVSNLSIGLVGAYWTSTGYNGMQAYYIAAASGNGGGVPNTRTYGPKSEALTVRSIRAF